MQYEKYCTLISQSECRYFYVLTRNVYIDVWVNMLPFLSFSNCYVFKSRSWHRLSIGYLLFLSSPFHIASKCNHLGVKDRNPNLNFSRHLYRNMEITTLRYQMVVLFRCFAHMLYIYTVFIYFIVGQPHLPTTWRVYSTMEVCELLSSS